MNLKEELAKIKSRNIPSSIQKLIDKGVIQECEEMNKIYYITFAFEIIDAPVYNYEYRDSSLTNFSEREFCSIIYCCGMALDSKLNVLRGIIYPYYFDYDKDSWLFKSDTPIKQLVTIGKPQIICKNMKTKLKDWFTLNGFKLFNIVTDNANAWADFINGNEKYKDTMVVLDKNGYLISPDKYCETQYYGNLFSCENNKPLGLHRYVPFIASSSQAVTIDYVSKYLNDQEINRNIVSKIYCANSISSSIKTVGKSIKQGMDNVARSNIESAKLIGGQIEKIAKANGYVSCMY